MEGNENKKGMSCRSRRNPYKPEWSLM